MIIGNDTELRKYIPNVLATVEGESSLYDKLLPYLQVATDWLCRTVIATEYPAFQRVQENAVEKCIVAEAFRQAVPSLDIVLTPNGFGIVSTDRIAPASKERIERLQAQLELYRDELIINIITQLHQNYSEWTQQTTQGKRFFSTFFPTPELARLCGYTEHLWDHYQQLLPKVLLIQQRLANEFFSPELINALLEDIRTRKYTYPSNYYLLRRQVTDTIRSLILDELNGHPVHPQSYYDLVNTIRNNPKVFPEWQNTKTAELFTPKVFENKKQSGGYWF
jgi:hypothetical protein